MKIEMHLNLLSVEPADSQFTEMGRNPNHEFDVTLYGSKGVGGLSWLNVTATLTQQSPADVVALTRDGLKVEVDNRPT